jgi:hypothetical protein
MASTPVGDNISFDERATQCVAPAHRVRHILPPEIPLYRSLPTLTFPLMAAAFKGLAPFLKQVSHLLATHFVVHRVTI